MEEVPTEENTSTTLSGNLIALDDTWEDATVESYLLCIRSIEPCPSHFSNLSQAALQREQESCLSVGREKAHWTGT